MPHYKAGTSDREKICVRVAKPYRKAKEGQALGVMATQYAGDDEVREGRVRFRGSSDWIIRPLHSQEKH